MPSSQVHGSSAPSHRRIFPSVALLVALSLLALVSSAAASITTRYPPLASFGPDGTSGTIFGGGGSVAYSIAVDQANDKLYVFDPSGPTIHAFGIPALTPSGGNFPLPVVTGNCCKTPVAVDNGAGASAGHLYYVGGDNKIYGFDSTGFPLGGNFPFQPSGANLQAGAAVDSAGNLFVSDFIAKAIRKFDSAGNLLGTINAVKEGTGPAAIAFDSQDDLFVSHQSSGLYKYTAASGYTSGTLFAPPFVEAVAVDKAAHRVFALYSNRVDVYDSDTGAFIYRFGVGGSGIAVDEGTDRAYIVNPGSHQASVYGPAQSFADATGAPTPAKEVTDTSATIGATITDNNALPTRWRLELSAAGPPNWQPVKSGETTGGQSNLAVSANVTGLDPNTEYRFRVVTNKGEGAATESPSISGVFQTAAVPPVVTDPGVVNIADTSARLVGTIDPRHSATGYVFAYGTTPALGTFTDPVAIGSGATPLTVSEVVSGLSKDTTYYFKLVATNEVGSTVSVAKTFHTRAAPLPLPDDRHYEMVSPPGKNYTDINTTVGIDLSPEIRIAPGGDAVAWCTSALFGEPPAQMTSSHCGNYLARRTVSGWQTSSPFPHFCGLDIYSGAGAGLLVDPSPDLSRALVGVPESAGCAIPPLDPAAPLLPGQANVNFYLQDLNADPPNYELLTPQLASVSANGRGADTQGSTDFSHVVFHASGPLTPDAPANGTIKIYGSHDGVVDLVSKDMGGTPFTTASSLSYISGVRTAKDPLTTPVSADGKRIYFQNPLLGSEMGDCSLSSCELYMRENHDQPQSPLAHGAATGSGNLSVGSPTVSGLTTASGGFQIGQTIAGTGIPGNTTISACSPSCASPTGLTLSAAASAAGGGVALTAYSECTDAALACTYDVSATECTVNCGASRPDHFIWANPSGDKAFFASCAKLTDASAPDESSDGCRNYGNFNFGGKAREGSKLYRWDRDAAPGHRLVDLTVDNEPGDGVQPNFEFLVGASDDGDTAYFVTGSSAVSNGNAGQIVPGAPTAPQFKLFRWRWNSGSPTVDYLGPYMLTRNYDSAEDTNSKLKHRQVTPDGKYLMLLTKFAYDPAVDRDSDADVYRWSAADGWICVSCQRPGEPSNGPAGLREMTMIGNSSLPPQISMSDDGQRIFFESPDALVPEDVNGDGGCPLFAVISAAFEEPREYTCQDVYEWDDGTLSLISSGTGAEPSYLIGITPSGSDVFFVTPDRLVGWDADTNRDIYDARVGDGFPEPPPTGAPCEGEACRDAGTGSSTVQGAGSAVFQGPNDPKPTHHAPRKKRPKKRKHHGRTHHRTANHNRRAAR